MTLKAIIAQLQGMDAHLDTLTDEISQVTTSVGCIARRQAHLGGFVAFPPPSPQASKDKYDDDSSGDDDDDDEEDVNSSSDKVTTAS